MKVTMSTGTGHISSRIIPQLLEAGAEVTVISRSPQKLADLQKRGVRIVEGSLEDVKVVTDATRGADVLFWMSPPNFIAEDVIASMLAMAENAASAIQENNIPRVVNLSSIGAEERSGIGIVSGLGQVEDVLDRSSASVTHFRPTFFMENFEMQIQSILEEGKVYMAFDGNKPVPQIATADIAKEMASRILDNQWTGTSAIELHGHSDLSFAAAASMIGKALGRDVQYVQISPEQQVGAMLGMGASHSMAEQYTELMTGIDSGVSKRLYSRTEQSTTQTSFSSFIEESILPMVSEGQARSQG